jgi:hypothetical protein
MNKSTESIEASKLRNRIKSMMDQEMNKRFDLSDLRRERNDRGAVQVRSIASNISGAVFGQQCSGNCIVGP